MGAGELEVSEGSWLTGLLYFLLTVVLTDLLTVCLTYSPHVRTQGHYGSEEVEVAVVGLRLESEHEDTCCATIELRGAAAALAPSADEASQEAAVAALLAAAKAAVASGAVSKGSKPDRIRFAPIPKNFKGAVLTPDLVKAWKLQAGVKQ